ncbi:MAG: amino acid adenylation domain-containing protein [Corynebacteriales bacterium]|nr:amino acid adenylation domain-containing protein [Mycobacteriales bacterium]
MQSEQAGLLEAHHIGLPAIQRDLGVPALFDTLVVFESYPVDREALENGSQIDGMSVDGAQINDASHYPMTVLAQSDPHLSISLKYIPALIGHGRADDLGQRVLRVLRAFARAGATPVRDLHLLDADEVAGQLESWNDTSVAVGDATVTEMFARRVRETPDDIAFTDGERTVTFAEFDAMANRRARVLIAYGVGPDDLVAVAMPRSLEQVATVYGVGKAGAAYLPIDVDAPADRMTTLVAEAGVRCVVTDAGRLAAIRTLVAPVACLDLAAPGLRHISDAPIQPTETRGRVRAASLAYVLFTSGSTGRPKGVAITQRALANQVRWIAEEYRLGRDDVVLLKTPFTFDASVWEMFAPALAGARTVIAGPRAHTDATELVSLVSDHAVTVVQFVPSVLAVFAESAGPDSLDSLRTVFSGGEALPISLAQQVASTSGAQVVNLYGPTEVTVDATSAVVVAAGTTSTATTSGATDVVPIGRPVWNTRGWVLDRWLRPCVLGAVGELYLSGDQLARGYLGRADLTAERFVPSVFGPAGAQMYRTGDLARRLPDGTLDYVGRVDFQVKVRGLRIELEEIETVLAQHDSVAQSAVIAHETEGRTRLIGYVIGHGDADVDAVGVRDHAGRVLPPYMVPDVIVVLDEFPRGRSGKIARRELPLPQIEHAARRAPATESEAILCGIVADLLGADVGADDSFFDIGGDSIGAMQLVTRARSAGIRFTARDVLEKRTIAALAAVASTHGSGTAADRVDAHAGSAPLTPVIEKLLERGGDINRFVMPMVFTVPAEVTSEQIVAAMTAVVDRHDVMRSRLDIASRTLEIGAAGTVDLSAALTRIDLDSHEVPGSAAHTARLRTAVADAIDDLDPEAGAMLRLVWLAPASQGQTGRLAVVAHHLVVDAVSWRILQSDIAVAGSQVSAGHAVDLPDAGTSWIAWSAGQLAAAAGRRAELDHWVSVLDGPDPALGTRRLDLTTDRVDRLARAELVLPAEIVAPLAASLDASRATPGQEGITLADLLVAGLATAVVGWRRDRGYDVTSTLLTLEGHGREEAVVDGADLSRTVGWFTSMFPTRVDLDGLALPEIFDRPEVAEEVVARTRAAMTAHPDRGIGYGMLRHLDPEGRERLGGFADPQIVFNYIGAVPGSDVTADVDEVPWFPDMRGPELLDVHDPEALARGNRMPAQAEIDIQSLSTATPDGPVVRALVTYLDDAIDSGDLDELFEHWILALRAIADRTAGEHPDGDRS